MAEQFAAGLGRRALAFDEGVVGDGGTQCTAPADAFLHGLAGGGDGHGVKPPAFFGCQRFPVVQGIGNIVGGGFFYGPAEDAEFFAQRRVHRDGPGRILRKPGYRQAVGTQAAVGFFPKCRGERQPAVAVDNDAQRRIVGRWLGNRACAEMIELIAPVLGDADPVVARATLGNVNQEPVAGFLGQKTQSDNFAGGRCACHVYSA